MVAKITDEARNVYFKAAIEGNKNALSHLYVQAKKAKWGGYVYKVQTTRFPLLSRIYHLFFSRISTKYVYGEEAFNKIQKLNLLPNPAKLLEPSKEKTKPKPPVVPTWKEKILEILVPKPHDFKVGVQELAQKFATISNPEKMEVRGQLNLGNTCYMNSTLQCLEAGHIQDPACMALLKEDLSLKEGEDLKGLEQRLLKQWVPLEDEKGLLFKWTYLLLLQAKFKGSQEDIDKAVQLHHKLFFATTTIKDFKTDIFGQKDAPEYLECFLEILGPQDMVITDVFEAKINGENVQNEHVQPTSSNFIKINIDDQEHSTFASRLRANCTAIMSEKRDFTLPDNSIKEVPGYTKSTRYIDAPDTLHFQIARFIKDGITSTKNETFLQMDDIEGPIDFSPVFDGEYYQLAAFSVHGGGLNSGHYVAYVQRDGQWHYISDSNTFPVDQNKVPFGDAYLMTFTKIQF